MTAENDIVTRLRKRVDRLAEDGEHHKLLLIDEAADEIERLRAEVTRLGSFIHPIGTIIHDNHRKLAETLGSGEYISAPFDGTVKDIHASCRNEVERWQGIARRLYLFIQDPCTHNHWCDTCSSIDAYEKAVEDE